MVLFWNWNEIDVSRCNVYGTVNPKVSKTAVYSKSQDEEARIREVADEQVLYIKL